MRWTLVQTLNARVHAAPAGAPRLRIHGHHHKRRRGANIIPEYASAIFYVRAPSMETMWDLYPAAHRLRRGAAKPPAASSR